MEEVSAETPWAMVNRMRGEGAPFERMVAALRERGLSTGDIELLLEGAPELVAWQRAQSTAPARTAPRPEPTEPPTAPTGGLPWLFIIVGMVVFFIGAAQTSAVVWAPFGVFTFALVANEFRKGRRRPAQRLAYSLFFVCFVPALGGFIGHWGWWQIAGAVGLAA
jgi:hypothetical protein